MPAAHAPVWPSPPALATPRISVPSGFPHLADLAAAWLESCTDVAPHLADPCRRPARVLYRREPPAVIHAAASCCCPSNAVTLCLPPPQLAVAPLRAAVCMIAHAPRRDRDTFSLHAAAAKGGLSRQTFTESALISGYAKAGDPDPQGVRRKHEPGDAFISGFSQAGESKEALTLFHELRRHGMAPDHLVMRSGQLVVTLPGALVDMCAKCGRTDLTTSVFAEANVRRKTGKVRLIPAALNHRTFPTTEQCFSLTTN
ncbi:hypothetical protein BDA96_03G304200 [Sorghum bicolor]|uniref:DYW domain-containing protein n=1 Tax=Sorghum bicolor TaxID=4558 RepID=A0A921RHA6_SORBI|nr:hypothetical protein BDA96_03G304200 [Sorghum bicolor]